MKDSFNLNEINKNIIDLVKELTNISKICEDYILSPTDNNGENIIDTMEKSEKILLKVKNNIVKMIETIDTDEVDITSIENNGFRIE